MKRLAQASAVFSLISTAASLSSHEGTRPVIKLTASFEQPRRRRPSDSLSSSDTTAAVRTRTRQRRRKMVQRPPAVDSKLLRFLGTQREQALNEMSILDPQQQPKYLDDSLDSWLGQYNRYRVAALLVAKDSDQQQQQQHGGGVEESLALAAGERVQSQALARTARRRVREFLKQRDQAWDDAELLPYDSMSSETVAAEDSSTARSSRYTLEETIDLLLEYGLTHKDIAEIMIHSPGIVLMRPKPLPGGGGKGECLQETLERVLPGLLCGTLKLRKYDARKVIRNCPALLTMRGSRSAEQVVALLSRLGVSSNSIARDKNALPTLLSRSPAAVFRLVAFLSSDAVRMPMDNIGPLLRRSQCQELLDVVAPVPGTDSNSDEWDDVLLTDDETMDRSVVSALWGRSSQMRRERINEAYRNMTRTAWILRHEIGTADLGKVIAAYPAVLLLDAEKQILPTASYLMNDLGMWKDDLPRVLQLYPALLGMDIADMQRVADFLLSLDIAPENLASIFRSFPSLLTMDVKKDMVPVVDFLRNEVGIANVGRFIARLPPVLGYSVSNEIQPKWEFLQTVCTDPRFELTRFPAYFSYPLERVIKTRFEYLQQVKKIPTPLVQLDHVLRFGDRDFAVKVARDTDNGLGFQVFGKHRKMELSPKRRKRQQPKKKSSTNKR